MNENKLQYKFWDKVCKSFLNPIHCCVYGNGSVSYLGVWCTSDIEVLPYTGHKDKNDKKIYKGDIINSYQNDYMPVEVYWDEVLCGWATQNYHSTLSLPDSMNSKTEILGNVFEYPELKKWI